MNSARIAVGKFCPVCARTFSPEDSVVTCRADGAELLPHTDDGLAGRTIDGKFQLLEIIGTGGCSIVYRARHISLQRMVAVKVLRADLISTVDRIKRFEQEAVLASSVKHPNICAVYDCGMLATGQPYLVMENVEGNNLSDVLSEGKVEPLERALRLIGQIVAGMKAAHQKALLHRDLKPGNIMLVDSSKSHSEEPSVETVKIIDFGLAKVLGTEGVGLTASGHAVGTPAYMSPEQVRGEELDVRSDIYSLGCVMYELLTARRAIAGNTAFDTMQNHLYRQPAAFSSEDLLLPFALRDLVLKCMQKEPIDRFQSMAEVEAALEQINVSVDAPTASLSHSSKNTSSNKQPAPLPITTHAKAALNLSWRTTAVVIALVATASFAFALIWGSSSGNRDSNSTFVTTTSPSLDPAIARLIDEYQQLLRAGHAIAADRVLRRAFDTLHKQGKQHSREMLVVARELKAFYAGSNRRTASIPYIQAAFEAQRSLVEPLSAELLLAHQQAGRDYEKAGSQQRAMFHLKSATELAKTKYGTQSKQYYDALREQAELEMRIGALKDSEAHLKFMLAEPSSHLESDAARIPVLLNLFKLYDSQHREHDAQAVSDEAVALLKPTTPAEIRVNALKTAALMAERKHEFRTAAKFYSQAADVSSELAKGRQLFWLTDELLIYQGSALRRAKDYKQAEQILQRGLREAAVTHKPESYLYEFGMSEYAKLLRETSRNAEADALIKAGRF